MNGTLVLQTIVAMVLAVLTYAVVSFLVGGLLTLFNMVFTVLRLGIIEFMAVIAGSAAGVLAARAACDNVLRAYSERALFVMFAALAVLGAGFEFFFVPLKWEQIISYAQCATVVVAAYSVFWKGEVF